MWTITPFTIDPVQCQEFITYDISEVYDVDQNANGYYDFILDLDVSLASLYGSDQGFNGKT